MSDDKRQRIAFDPEDPIIREALTLLSEELGIPPGDLLNYGAVIALLEVLAGSQSLSSRLKPSRLLRYNKRVDISDLIEELKKQIGKHK